MRIAVTLACLLAGCAVRSEAPAASASPVVTSVAPAASGAGAESMPPSPQQQIVFDDHQTLLRLATEIEALASAEDCGSACEGGERLCALSERICAIADRNPDDGEVGARCDDGRTRCRTARERLAAACGCADE